MGNPAPTTIPANVDGQVDLVLARQPRLAAARAAVERERAHAEGAAYYPDPFLQVAPIGRMAETAAGTVKLMTSITQRFPFPGKLDAATGAAEALRAQADAQAEATAASVTADLRRSWWRRWEATSALAILAEQHAVVRRLQQAADARVAAGRSGQEDLLRLNVELGGLDVQASAFRGTAAAAIARVRRLMLLPESTTVPPPGEPPMAMIGRDLAAWQALALERSPAIHESEALQSHAAARIHQARLDRYPDVTLGFTYNQVADDGLAKSANGQDQWWVSVGVNLPIWTGRLDAAEDAAAADRRRARALDVDARTTATDRVAEVWAAREAATDQLRILDTDILPAAHQALAVVESRYAGGAADYQDLIETWREVLIQELARIRARAAAGIAEADLLEAAGLAVPPSSPEPGSAP